MSSAFGIAFREGVECDAEICMLATSMPRSDFCGILRKLIQLWSTSQGKLILNGGDTNSANGGEVLCRIML
jgi:hypothetical protein